MLGSLVVILVSLFVVLKQTGYVQDLFPSAAGSCRSDCNMERTSCMNDCNSDSALLCGSVLDVCTAGGITECDTLCGEDTWRCTKCKEDYCKSNDTDYKKCLASVKADGRVSGSECKNSCRKMFSFCVSACR